MQTLPPTTLAGELSRLWAPGPHLGWGFRDRATLMQPFLEPPPEPPQAPQKQSAAGRWRVAGLGAGAASVLACCGMLASGPGGSSFGSIILGAAIVAMVTTAGLVWLLWWSATGSAQTIQRRFERDLARWRDRRDTHLAAEQARLAAVPEWGTVRLDPGCVRLDVVGGGLYGWEALLTVAGASYLATHGPSLIVDLTGEAVCRELIGMCAVAGVDVDLQVLPIDLDDSDLLEGINPDQLVDIIVESIHGDHGEQSRAERAADARILTGLMEALPNPLTMARIVAALRLLLGEPEETGALSLQERARVRDLFSADYLRDTGPVVRRLEACLYPLRRLGSLRREPAMLTAVAMATDGTSVRNEVLDDLIVSWLSRRIVNEPSRIRTLVIAGADRLPGRQLARLSDLCARRGVRLIVMWRHLRDHALQALGQGAVAFMRLGSAEEAAHAADFIGRQHRFVTAGLTYSVGGSRTHSTGTSDTRSESYGGGGSRGPIGKLTDVVRQGRGWPPGEATNWNQGRSWGVTQSVADGTSWTGATSVQRVFEHAIEPTVLQSLPDYALLLVQHRNGGIRVRALDCNPDLINLTGASMHPLPDVLDAVGIQSWKGAA